MKAMLDLKERSKPKFIKHCTVFCQKNAKSSENTIRCIPLLFIKCRAQTQLLINQ
ncbi:hypothetical protein FC25_GL001988 [Ligilactobacillus ruminis DSM 20403 = NBRC 102161]|nr:hypothetical protein FC25_GL001988 [Ligilactobacillus ruminis DSM 20403 = NBRC 102161]